MVAKDSAHGDEERIDRDEVSDSEPDKQIDEATQVEEGEQEAEVEVNEEESIESVREQLEAQKYRYLRLMAEFDNYKRRTSREYERMVLVANEDLLKQIIDVRESFERALAMSAESDSNDKLLEGMKLIFTKLDDVLKRNGLDVFGEPGEEFNPELHDAMMKQPSSEYEENHIVQIFEKGYSLKGRVIKHAKVIVSGGAEA